MNPQGKRIVKAVSLILALALVQVYVQANLIPASIKDRLTFAMKGGGLVAGRLTTRGNNSITVNGNSARSGETILSGAQIQTPSGVGATLQFGHLGKVDVAPDTILNVSYTSDLISVNVSSGCQILTPGEGVTGTVITPEGSTNLAGSTTSPLNICVSREAGSAAPVVKMGAAANAGALSQEPAATPDNQNSKGGGLFGLGKTGTILLISAAAIGITTAAVVIPCRRGPNPSPGTPRGRNDECR